MTPRSIIIAGSFAQCALAVMAVGVGLIASIVAAGCLAEAVTAMAQSEREN